MRTEPAGDTDYDAGLNVYGTVRREEPMFSARVHAALQGATSLINVGAGAGSYEPVDIEVTPVEPSAAMRSQRPAHLAPAIDAVADDLPFPDDAFDAALASVTVHQWPDLGRGLAEMRRVTRGPIVILTFEPAMLRGFWLSEYAPEVMEHESGRMPSIEQIARLLGGTTQVEELAIPAGCSDGFAEAFFGRPEAFLEDRVRRSQSAWSFVDAEVEERSVAALRSALDDGSWDERHGHLRSAPLFNGSFRLLSNLPER